MINNLTTSLKYLGIDYSNMEYKPCDKNLYKFEDPIINKHWLSFLAFYRAGHRQGRIDELNEVSINAIDAINKIK